MGFDINWGLAAPVDVGGALTNGFERGKAMRQESDTRSALAAYGMNPSEETAGVLMRADPRIGMQAMTTERAKAQQLRQQQIASAAVTGDPTAKAQLAGINPELWMKLDDRTKAQIKKSTEFMGNAVYDISRSPEAERPAKWRAYVQSAESQGMDIPTQYETYSPQALNAIVAEVGHTEDFIKFNEPEYKVIPQGGYAQGFQYGIPIAGGPSTTQPPQAGGMAPPNPGDVVKGFRFKGGSLNDPSAWEAAPEPASANDAAPILRQAQSTGAITRADAERVRSSLGPNGGASFQQWLTQHNIRISDQ